MKPDIWAYFDGRYKAHVPNKDDYQQMIRWDGVEPDGTYSIKGEVFAWDIVLTEEYVDKVRALLLKRLRKSTSPSKGDNDLRGAIS